MSHGLRLHGVQIEKYNHIAVSFYVVSEASSGPQWTCSSKLCCSVLPSSAQAGAIIDLPIFAGIWCSSESYLKDRCKDAPLSAWNSMIRLDLAFEISNLTHTSRTCKQSSLKKRYHRQTIGELHAVPRRMGEQRLRSIHCDECVVASGLNRKH